MYNINLNNKDPVDGLDSVLEYLNHLARLKIYCPFDDTNGNYPSPTLLFEGNMDFTFQAMLYSATACGPSVWRQKM